jgi:hypothetical protein
MRRDRARKKLGELFHRIIEQRRSAGLEQDDIINTLANSRLACYTIALTQVQLQGRSCAA